MPRRVLTEEEREQRRTRVSPYEVRIGNALTQFMTDVPMERQAGRQWQLVRVAHTIGHAQCQLCGHNPIRRLFFIQNTADGNRELMIGSECARNYVGVDLVDAYLRRMAQEANIRRRDERRRVRAAHVQAARLARLQAAEVVLDAEQGLSAVRVTDPELDRLLREEEELEERTNRNFIASASGVDVVHDAPDVYIFLSNERNLVRSSFLRSVADQMRRTGRLTVRQVGAVQRLMPGASERQAESVILNGVYTYSTTTFDVYTVQSGPLAGRRIIRLPEETSGSFRGVAFLDGNEMSTWRRFQDHVTTRPFLDIRNALVVLATEDARVRLLQGSDGVAGVYHTVTANIRCQTCNRPTSGVHCYRHASPEPIAPVAASAAAPAPRQLQLSEIGTGEVQ